MRSVLFFLSASLALACDYVADADQDEVCVPEPEICDLKDNDCDGLINYVIVAGTPVSVCHEECRPTALVLNDAEASSLIGQPPPTCLDDQGDRLMIYDMMCPGPWSTCRYGTGMDLSAFDRGEGYLVVEFEVLERPVTRGLNLWYGPHPNRRQLRLKDIDIALMPGRYLRYFHAGDSCTDPNVCSDGCPNKNRCSLPDEAMKNAHLTIAAEDCHVDRAQGTIALVAVTYYPSACQCVNELGCARGTACRSLPDHYLPDERCPNGTDCAGLCSPPNEGCEDATWEGLACAVISAEGGFTCVGHLTCVLGLPSCIAEGCG